jgi:hypothetical protein
MRYKLTRKKFGYVHTTKKSVTTWTSFEYEEIGDLEVKFENTLGNEIRVPGKMIHEKAPTPVTSYATVFKIIISLYKKLSFTGYCTLDSLVSQAYANFLLSLGSRYDVNWFWIILINCSVCYHESS